MLLRVCSLDNEEISQINLKDEFCAVEGIRRDIIKRVIDWQLAKARGGSHKIKTRAEVSGSNRKPFAQKGTGRARQGSTRAPHMRGGGVVHGPAIRSHAVSLPKKVRRLGLIHAISSKCLSQKMIVVDSLALNDISVSKLSKKIQAFTSDSVLFIDSLFDKNFYLSCRKLPKCDMLLDVGANVYDIIKHKYLMISKVSAEKLQSRLLNE